MIFLCCLKKRSTDKLRKKGAENRPDYNTKDLKLLLQTSGIQILGHTESITNSSVANVN